jgi:hypothetical protein
MTLEQAIEFLEEKGAIISKNESDYYYNIDIYDDTIDAMQNLSLTEDEVINLCDYFE